jgi:glutamate-1-semialdehyde 2,1-aminomutase
MLVKAGSGLAGQASSDSAGVSERIAQQTLVCPLDDELALEGVFLEHGKDIAAVIIEPMPANYGLLLQRPEFLRKVYDLARSHGALVIFDEVISGFRAEFGGMAQRLGLKPDLVTYGKILGGGLAVGAYAGRADLMDQVAPAGRVYQAGTLSANPLAMRTGLATLTKLKNAKVHEILEERTSKFVLDFKETIAPAGFDIVSLGSVFWIHPRTSKPLRSLQDLPPGMGEQFGKLFHSLLKHGIYLAPSGYEVGFISLAHTSEVLSDALARIKEAVRELR